MMIRLIINCVVTFVLPLDCIFVKIMRCWFLPDGGNRSHCRYLVAGFCSAGVDSGGLDRPLC